MKLTTEDFESMEKLTRVQLATSLPGAKPMCLVGTQSTDGITNLAPFSSIVHLGSNPMLIGMVTRPATVERHTLNNILATKHWTINHVHKEILPQAHQCSARYQLSEFDASGLTAHHEPDIIAPFVAESRIRFALQLKEIIDIESNNTRLIVGQVILIEFDDTLRESDGGIDLVQADTLASTALDTYFTITPHSKLPYAKP